MHSAQPGLIIIHYLSSLSYRIQIKWVVCIRKSIIVQMNRTLPSSAFLCSSLSFWRDFSSLEWCSYTTEKRKKNIIFYIKSSFVYIQFLLRKICFLLDKNVIWTWQVLWDSPWYNEHYNLAQKGENPQCGVTQCLSKDPIQKLRGRKHCHQVKANKYSQGILFTRKSWCCSDACQLLCTNY